MESSQAYCGSTFNGYQSTNTYHGEPPVKQTIAGSVPHADMNISNIPQHAYTCPDSAAPNRQSHLKYDSNALHWSDQLHNDASRDGTFTADHTSSLHMPASSLRHFPYNPSPPPNMQRPNLMASTPNGLAQPMTDDELLEDYRSVIDDLTVRNRRLKARLKRFEQKDHEIDSDKLIEVKLYGVSGPQKRQLEEMLTAFACNIDQPLLSNEPSSTTKPGSSHASAKFADSAYGSLVASSQAAPSKSIHGVPRLSTNSTEAASSRYHDTQSSSLHIPEDFQPRQMPIIADEEVQKQLVVSRLEHLFSNQDAPMDVPPPSQHRQEVSHVVVRDDCPVNETCGKREADIMIGTVDGSSAVPSLRETSSAAESDTCIRDTRPDMPPKQPKREQRPTRPLDLDPLCAPNPRENISYVRHLGFSMMDGETSDTAGDQGWLYLNLVMNMAQLHTLNVTVGLVQEAVREYSSHFELSKDGQKIRWRAEPLARRRKINPVTKLSAINASRNGKEHGRKRYRSTCHTASSTLNTLDTSSSKRSAIPSSYGMHSIHQDVSPFASDAVDGVALADCDATPAHDFVDVLTTQEPSEQAHSGKRNVQMGVLPHHADGHMIFYRRQRFFIDRSGDNTGHGHQSAHSYDVCDVTPLGAAPASVSHDSCLGKSFTFPNHVATSVTSLDVHADCNSTHERPSSHSNTQDNTPAEVDQPYRFEASGVAGIHPSDNFVLYVTRQLKIEDCPPPKRRKVSALQDITECQPRGNSSVAEIVTAVDKQLLPPSTLPPATYAISHDELDLDAEDDAYSQSSSSSPFETHDTLAYDPSSVGSRDQNEFDDGTLSVDSERQSSSEYQLRYSDSRNCSLNVDLLASARPASPRDIMTREREYSAGVAARVAEERPAGISRINCRGRPGSGDSSHQGEGGAAEEDEAEEGRLWG